MPHIQNTKPRTKLARMRTRSGIAQEDLAFLSGLSRSTVQRLEGGRIDNPPIRYLANCAHALGCELTEILEDEWIGWTDFPGADERQDISADLRAHRAAGKTGRFYDR